MFNNEEFKPAKYIKPNGDVVDLSDLYLVSRTGKVLYSPIHHHYAWLIKHNRFGPKYYNYNKGFKAGNVVSFKYTVKGTDGRSQRRVCVNRLVLSTFDPEGFSKETPSVKNNDGDVYNNDVSNLSWEPRNWRSKK